MIQPVLKIMNARYDLDGNFLFETNIGNIAMDMAAMIEVFSTYADSRSLDVPERDAIDEVFEGMCEYEMELQRPKQLRLPEVA